MSAQLFCRECTTVVLPRSSVADDAGAPGEWGADITSRVAQRFFWCAARLRWPARCVPRDC
jgi:hypothetical protein